jgi:hypothetical protein
VVFAKKSTFQTFIFAIFASSLIEGWGNDAIKGVAVGSVGNADCNNRRFFAGIGRIADSRVAD